MIGEWVKRARWKASHFTLADQRTVWLGKTTARTACGTFVSVDEGLKPEPTGIDTTKRCGRCERRLSREGQS